MRSLQRAKDHLKGSLVLGLESTASRMSQLARSEIYFGRQISVDENLWRVDGITAEDVQRWRADLFSDGNLAATVLGRKTGRSRPRNNSHCRSPRESPRAPRSARGLGDSGSTDGARQRQRGATRRC